jgi:putative oxidoreductase
MSANTIAVSSSSNAQGAVLLAGRALLSIMFILGGFSKLTAIGGTAAWFGSIGLPMPMVTAVLVGVVELVGGLAILVGYRTRLAAFVLAAFTIAATAIAHLDLADQVQQLFFMKNLAITGGFLVLAAFGAGSLSLDARAGRS